MLRYDSGWVFRRVLTNVKRRPATSWEELSALGSDLVLIEVTLRARREIVGWSGQRYIWALSDKKWFRAHRGR